MKYNISNEEKNIVLQFKGLRYPSIFKTDNTDRILFVENINFPICDWLLKGKTLSVVQYNETMEDFARFVKNTNVKEFDGYALNYYNLCLQVVEIMKKYHVAF